MSGFVPAIGVSGLFTLLAPFDTKLIQNVPYTCISIRRLNDIVANGGDPFEDYYQAYGIDAATFAADMQNDVSIISLQAAPYDVVHVPSTYITGAPNIGGVPYTVLALAMNIGAVPDSMDLTYLKSQLIDKVRDVIGIDTQVDTVAISHKTLISHVDHTALEVAREAKRTIVMTDYAKYLEAVAQRDAAYEKIQELEAALIATMPPP